MLDSSSAVRRRRRLPFTSVAVVLTLMAATACGSDPGDDGAGNASGSDAGGIRVVDVDRASEILGQDDVIVLDVRTPAEFEAGHLDGAMMIDFYRPDFQDLLTQLDPNASYLLYCRSGSRSGQTREMMAELGFADVADIDGGIQAWQKAGKPIAP